MSNRAASATGVTVSQVAVQHIAPVTDVRFLAWPEGSPYE
jgi:hypothetical protein